MWFTKNDDGYRAWFTVADKNGALRTGGVPADFVATVVNPTGVTTTVLAVSESAGKPGLYTFLVPSSFFATHGIGGYGVVVQANITTAPKVTAVFGEVLRVFEEDFDSVSVLVNNVGTAVAGVAADLLAQVVDGTTTVQDVLTRLNSMAKGRIVLAGSTVYAEPSVTATYYAEDGTTVLFTNDNTGTNRDPV